MHSLLQVDLLLNVLHLEVQVDRGILDPLETLVEVFKRFLHLSELLFLSVVSAAHEIEIGCSCMLLVRRLDLIINDLEAAIEILDVGF